MKRLALLPAFLAISLFVYTQDYDLIVRQNGDSIVCMIDSLGEDFIFFRMKSNSSWIETNISMDKVAEYKYDVIHKKDFVYLPGTSIIRTSVGSKKTVFDIQKNSVYTGLAFWYVPFIYERTIPAGNKFAFLLGGGLIQTYGWGSETALVGKTAFLIGGPRHFFEGGFYLSPFNDEINRWMSIVGYRYQSRKGFLFRADMALVMMGITVGYSF